MKKGFTLVELIMAVVVAGIAVYALIGLFINTTSKNAGMEDVSIAAQLAEGKLEAVSSQSYDNISSEALSSFGGSFGDFYSQVIVINVASSELNTSVGAGDTGYKKITVYVSGGTLTSSLEISTLATDVSNE
ncbi:MAG: type II secretion system protein [Candidatus Margulisbacteria bacterium]|nr:type II secretion system protein [Candidatus Margulisiibacteriota bacterium]